MNTRQILLHTLSSFEGTKFLQPNSPVAIARRSHPFPYRTRKLSFSAPMVVRGCPLVRVGRCRAYERAPDGCSFLCVWMYYFIQILYLNSSFWWKIHICVTFSCYASLWNLYASLLLVYVSEFIYIRHSLLHCLFYVLNLFFTKIYYAKCEINF